MRLFFLSISLILFLLSPIFAKPAFAAVVVNPISLDNSTPIIGNTFNLTATISGAINGSNYYFKCRIGANSSSLNEGQTYNPTSSKWLDDTGSTSAWIDMPQIKIDNLDGTWQGNLQCRIKSSANDEKKLIYVMACLNSGNSCVDNFQSSASLSLNPIYPTTTPSPNPTSSPTPTSTPTNTPTPTVKPTATSTPTVTPKLTNTPTPVSNASMSATAQQQVLGQRDESLFAIPSGADEKDKNILTFSASDNKIISSIFMFIGIVFIVLCVIVIAYPKIDDYIKSK